MGGRETESRIRRGLADRRPLKRTEVGGRTTNYVDFSRRFVDLLVPPSSILTTFPPSHTSVYDSPLG